MKNENGRLKSERGAADFLGLTYGAMQRLRNAGEFPFVLIGRQHKYDEHDLLDWLETRKERHE